MSKYSEYFYVDEGYYPEINPNSIKDPENKWTNTFPHPTFVKLLDATERMLAAEDKTVKKGIWIEGAFGTGKSRIAWAIKNILDCSADELKAYFDEYEVLREKPDLRDKLLAHKEGRIITCYRYASGDITSTKKLIMAIYDSVTKALKKAKIDYKGEKTLRGKVAIWIAEHKEIFELLMEKPEYRGLGSFSGKTADDIVLQLQSVSASADILLNNILLMAEEEGITAFNITMDDLTQWLSDIIDENHLKAFVFVWDEFSSYFKNNTTTLDEFQRLAELSNEKPFYLMIVTHMSGSLVNESDQSFKIVRDRFVRKEIEMPDNVAFDLIGHALKIKEAAKDTWEELSEDLNSYMTESRKAVAQLVKISDTVLTKILPIQPMAALLLKYISSAFASNQRSMFNFIKNNDSDDLQAFQWFINNYSPDDNDILTMDFLWNFFYEKGTDERSSSSGRSNLDSIIVTILDTYPSNEAKLNTEQRRALKTVLMMQAISQKLNNQVELLRPNIKNINLAFEGDSSMDNNHAANIVKNQLVDKYHILYVKPTENGDEYAASAVSGDQVQIDTIKKRIASETRTSKLVSDGELISALTLTSGLRARYVVVPVTYENLKSTINRISNERKTYQIKAVLCFARNEEEQAKLRDLIKTSLIDELYSDIVFIDTSASIMGTDRFEKYASFSANEEYWRPKDGKLADNFKKNSTDLLSEWKTDISNGVFYVYRGIDFVEPCGSSNLLYETLSRIVLKLYPLSLDNVKVTENFFSERNLSDGANKALTDTTGGIYQANSIIAIKQNTKQLSQLQEAVDELIQTRFKHDVRISFIEIFDFLMEKGFMPCNLYAYITGLLLKKYSDEPYRYGIGTAGDDGGKMSINKMQEYIGESIKHRGTGIKNYKEKYIEIMTQDQKAFVDFTTAAFGIPENLSVEQAAVRMRSKLKDLGYPIWAYKVIDCNDLGAFIDKISSIANSKQDENVPSLAGDLGKMLLSVPMAAANLVSLFTADNGKLAIEEFLKDFENGQILTLASEIGITDVMNDVKRQISSGEAAWLWDQETGEEELKNLLVDYNIIAISNTIIEKKSSFFSCMQTWKSYVSFIKTPCSVLIAKAPEFNLILSNLRDIAINSDLSHDKRSNFLEELKIKRDAFIEFLDKKEELFVEEYSLYVAGFSITDIKKLYTKLPTSSFVDNKSTFETNVSKYAEQIRADQKKFKLKQIWSELTSSNDPEEWSEIHHTPILAMVPDSDYADAKRVFATMLLQNPEENEIDFALEYLNSSPSFTSGIDDQIKIDVAFAKHIIGKYSAILTDLTEVRKHLDRTINNKVYDWHGNQIVASEIKKLAKSKYLTGGNGPVMSKIDEMSAQEAKDYLKKLVQESVDVGVEILTKGGN